MDNILYLSQFDLMSSLSEADLIEMDGMTSITTMPKNRQIQTPDTFTEGFYFVKRGMVRLYTLNPEGKQFTLDILKEGNVFGEMNGISLGTRTVAGFNSRLPIRRLPGWREPHGNRLRFPCKN